jgi:putative Mn2+ efflux pump MntP
MNLFIVILLAFGLCFDSFAVSLTYGMGQCESRKFHFFRFACILAFFQGILPLIGWALAAGFQQYISRVDHWIAFALLAFLGVRMILEARKADGEKPAEICAFDLKRTLLLGVATSIDALITGAALGMVALEVLRGSSQGTNMLAVSGIIFAVTFAACATGIFLGRTIGNRLGKYAEFVGGVILIVIGLKVLLEHLLAGNPPL